MKKELKGQMERIMDESSGAYTDVIVQFRSEGDQQLSELLKAVFETESHRSMMVSPSHMLPPQADAFELKSAVSASQQRRVRKLLREQGASFSANVALGNVALELLAKGAREAVPAAGRFMSSSKLVSAVSSIKSRLKSKADTAEPMHLKNIDGMRVKVHRGDLPDVIQENAEQIDGVFENVTIKTPPVSPADVSASASTVSYTGTTWGVECAKALSAWAAFGTRGERSDGTKVKVAVLDTGVDPTHPDIKPRLTDFAEFDSSGSMITQGLGHARDSGSHGTHVSGTVVGGNSSGGWIGMAPDAELIGGLVLNGGSGSLAQIIGGIGWAVNSDADVINLSLGGLTFDPDVGTPYQRAIVDALVRGTLVVAAIGNDGHQTTGAPGNDYFSLAVGAHDENIRCAGFSGGRTHILRQSSHIDPQFLPLVYTKPDMGAPGVRVKSSVPGDAWEAFNGTSMATPHVAGAAALLLAATGLSSRPAQQRAFLARDLLLGGVSDTGESGQDQRFGYGALNVLKSIDEALQRGF
ncbi:MAG: S8 family serine peptidase [Pseudomonadota bacterium]